MGHRQQKFQGQNQVEETDLLKLYRNNVTVFFKKWSPLVCRVSQAY